MIVRYFRSFSNKYPRLISFTTTSIGLGAPTAFLLHQTASIKDPDEREIMLKNFLDVEGCKQELSRHRHQKSLEKPTGNKPK